MAVPKNKVSKARRNKRRSAVWKLDAPAMSTCSNCGAYKAPHKVCKNCGYYNGVAVLKMDEAEKDSGHDICTRRRGGLGCLSFLYYLSVLI